MSAPLWDVVAVDLKTYRVRVLKSGLTKENAEAAVKLAVMRLRVDNEFFCDVETGKYRDGDNYLKS